MVVLLGWLLLRQLLLRLRGWRRTADVWRPGDVPHLLPRKLRLRHAIHVAVWRARCTTKRHTSTVAGGGGHVATRKRPSGRHHAARRHAAVHVRAVRCSRKDMRVGAIARRGVGGGTWKRRVAERDCGDAGRHWLRRRLG